MFKFGTIALIAAQAHASDWSDFLKQTEQGVTDAQMRKDAADAAQKAAQQDIKNYNMTTTAENAAAIHEAECSHSFQSELLLFANCAEMALEDYVNGNFGPATSPEALGQWHQRYSGCSELTDSSIYHLGTKAQPCAAYTVNYKKEVNTDKVVEPQKKEEEATKPKTGTTTDETKKEEVTKPTVIEPTVVKEKEEVTKPKVPVQEPFNYQGNYMMGSQEKAAFDYQNLVRSGDGRFMTDLESVEEQFTDANGMIRVLENKTRLLTKEGTLGVWEAQQKYYSQKGTALEWSDALALAADDHCNDKLANGHISGDGKQFWDRISRYATTQGKSAESIAYGSSTPEEMVRDLYIDDGVPTRGHRANITGPFKYTGMAKCKNADGQGTLVVLYAAGLKPYVSAEGALARRKDVE